MSRLCALALRPCPRPLLAGLAALLAGLPAAAQEVTGPSGMHWRMFDVVIEPEVARLRFVSEGLTAESFETVAPDFLWLCDSYALPALDAAGVAPAEIVISVADRELAFGETEPGLVQFFEGFRRGATGCEWELF